MGIAVLLIAAIGLAEQARPDGSESAGAATAPLSPEMLHSRQGAQSAAARIAAALGGEEMFNPRERHSIIERIVEPAQREELQRGFDADYSPAFNEQLGLDSQGRAPQKSTFVSRTMPVGVTVRSYNPREATVDVWCTSLFGLTTQGATDPIPVKTDWLTMTLDLRWTADGWRLGKFAQQKGPEPTDADATFGEAPQL